MKPKLVRTIIDEGEKAALALTRYFSKREKEQISIPARPTSTIARLAQACRAGDITKREYYSYLRLIEAKTRKPFYETTWSRVEVGDVVLAWQATGQIVRARVQEIAVEPQRVSAVLENGARWGQAFAPSAIVYVQSRF
jgi:hypothetical protein